MRIPAPERYAVHKLVVASARTGTHRAKSEKDLAQAAALVEVLTEARPYELSRAFEDAMSRGRKWSRAIEASLRRRPYIRAFLEGLD